MYKNIETKIGLAKKVLNEHLSTSQVFDRIARMTADSIRFISMDLTSPGGGKPIVLNLSGYGASYNVVAFQSDLLGQLESIGLRQDILNPVLTNPIQNQNGTVSFDLTANINPEKIGYTQIASSTQQ